MKLYPLEVTDKSDAELICDEKVNEGSCGPPISNHPQCGAAQRARKQITEWAEIIQASLEDVEDC